MRGLRPSWLGWGGMIFSALCLTSCGGRGGGNPGGDPNDPSPLAPQIAAITVPAVLAHGRSATWTVTWTSGTAPFTIEMETGGGTTTEVAAGTGATSPFTAGFTMVNLNPTQDVAYSYVVTVIDSQDRSDREVGEYVVRPAMNEQLDVLVPADMLGSVEANWAVDWEGGSEPYTITVDMGGGATEDVPGGTHVSPPFTKSFAMVNSSKTAPATYRYDVSVSDALGFSAHASGEYQVGPLVNLPPVIANASYIELERTLHVIVADPDGDLPLTVTITQPSGLYTDATTRTVSAGGAASAQFSFSANDIFTGGEGTTLVTVTDQRGGVSEAISVPVRIPAYLLAFDTLYAIPLQAAAQVGEPVMVVITSGVPAHAFCYLNGVGLTIDSPAELVAESFNVGQPGGERAALDGIWSWFPQDARMLLPPDGMIYPKNIGDGLTRWDFSLTPIDGADLSYAYGPIFSVQFTFSTPGVKHFGFQAMAGVKRTFYSDITYHEFLWDDISNDHAGVPSSVVVQ